MRDPRSIYIAAGSSEITIARQAIADVKALGFEVSYDWTADPGWATAVPGGADNRTREDKIRSAEADVRGIFTAYTFWLLAPAVASRGAYTEQGIALGVCLMARGEIGGRVIVSGPDATKDLFRSWPIKRSTPTNRLSGS